jgi:hypothetical protein
MSVILDRAIVEEEEIGGEVEGEACSTSKPSAGAGWGASIQ